MKKKHYMKPEQREVVLRHRMMLQGASRVESLSTSGLDQEDDINTSEEGGGSSIWDR